MRRPALLVVALVLAVSADVGVSSCVSLPQRGPVQSTAVEDNADGETLVDFTPAGPEAGSAPVPLVDNFLKAMTATPLNTYVAREFLTPGSSSSWAPERGTVVYGSQQLVDRHRGRVTLRLRDVVELDSRGTWRGDPTSGRGHDYDLRLVKTGGQWRISHPPDRLLIPRTHFDTQYQQYLLYFFDTSSHVLVPEPVYVPRGRQSSTLLVSALLKGPEPALRESERTFVPAGTSLDGISVPVSRGGTAEVPLSDKVLDVDDDQLNQLFAQIAWTLGQVPGVKRMRVTVDGTPVDLPASHGDVGINDFSEFDPAVAWASTALFGIRDGRVVSLGGESEKHLSGALGARPVGLRSVAVDLLAQHVAGVTGTGRRVVESDRDGVPGRAATKHDIRTVYSRGTDVLHPTYDLYGQLWVVDRTPAGARLSVAGAGAGPAQSVPAPGLTGAQVTHFALSRDGTRLATLVRRHGRDQLLVARVQRDSKGQVRRVLAAEHLVVPGTPGRVRDVAWRSPASLAVLTAPSAHTSQVLLMKVDGSSTPAGLVTDPQMLHERGTSLVTSPARGTPLYVDTPSGRLYALARDGQWHRSAVKPGLVAPTFVG